MVGPMFIEHPEDIATLELDRFIPDDPHVLCPRMLLQSLRPVDVKVAFVSREGCICGRHGTYWFNPMHHGDGENSSLEEVTRALRLLQADPRTCMRDHNIVYIPRPRFVGTQDRSIMALIDR